MTQSDLLFGYLLYQWGKGTGTDDWVLWLHHMVFSYWAMQCYIGHVVHVCVCVCVLLDIERLILWQKRRQMNYIRETFKHRYINDVFNVQFSKAIFFRFPKTCMIFAHIFAVLCLCSFHLRNEVRYLLCPYIHFCLHTYLHSWTPAQTHMHRRAHAHTHTHTCLLLLVLWAWSTLLLWWIMLHCLFVC